MRGNKKGLSDIASLQGLKTLHSAQKRSIPRSYQGSGYIDLYMLAREKDRLVKENSMLERRQKVIARRLESIEKDRAKLKASEIERLTKSIPANTTLPKEWNRVALHY